MQARDRKTACARYAPLVSTLGSIEAFLIAAAAAGWRVDRRDEAEPLELPADVSQRYGALPAGYRAFLGKVACAASADEGVWFLCDREFHRCDSGGFAWNEIERMALESASDERDRQRIRSFWDDHLPIMMAPDGDYDYLAIELAEGAVVHGSAPEWEDVSRVADSFAGWLSLLAQSLQDPASMSNAPLAVRVMTGRSR